MSLAEGDDHQPREYEDVRAPEEAPEAESGVGRVEDQDPGEPKAESPPEEPKAEPKAEPKKKGRPKKGEELCGRWTCAECGGNFSVRTKKHACTKPRGAVLPLGRALESVPPVPAPVTREPPRAETPPEPVVTFDVCRKFLFGEIKARRDARRERISVSMF